MELVNIINRITRLYNDLRPLEDRRDHLHFHLSQLQAELQTARQRGLPRINDSLLTPVKVNERVPTNKIRLLNFQIDDIITQLRSINVRIVEITREIRILETQEQQIRASSRFGSSKRSFKDWERELFATPSSTTTRSVRGSPSMSTRSVNRSPSMTTRSVNRSPSMTTRSIRRTPSMSTILAGGAWGGGVLGSPASTPSRTPYNPSPKYPYGVRNRTPSQLAQYNNSPPHFQEAQDPFESPPLTQHTDINENDDSYFQPGLTPGSRPNSPREQSQRTQGTQGSQPKRKLFFKFGKKTKRSFGKKTKRSFGKKTNIKIKIKKKLKIPVRLKKQCKRLRISIKNRSIKTLRQMVKKRTSKRRNRKINFL